MSATLSAAEQRTVAPLRPLPWAPIAIVTFAFLFRVAWLGIKPAHFDEGVNGWFVDQMTRQGYYHYDPGNFHGPLHFYILFLAQTLLGRAVWVLRLPLVLVSTACVAFTFAFRRFFSRETCTMAALAMAVSPGMIFYGRYAIHETWLLFFLMITGWGVLGLWKDGMRRDLWAVALGVTGMVLTKETYVIHVVSLLLAFPTLWILERLTPSTPAPFARQLWTRRDLTKVILICIGLIVFFYTGAFLDWPDFRREPGTVGSLAGLWETFTVWSRTGTGGETGHEKPWVYWLELLARYEWPAAAGLVMVPLILKKGSDRFLRYLAIAGTGTLTAYSIIAYKTPWCLIVMVWPFYFLFGHFAVCAARLVDRWAAWCTGILLISVSLLTAAKLNFITYTDETEPYVYVQTLDDVNKLMQPLDRLTSVSPAYYHLRGYILLPESDSHPLPWLLAPYSRVEFSDMALPPADMAADFLIVEDAIVSDVEERLQVPYFKESFVLRGSWGNTATLYLNANTFGPLFPGRTPEFHPLPADRLPPELRPDEEPSDSAEFQPTSPALTEP